MGAGTARGSRRVTPREQGTGVGCGLAVITGIVTLTVIVLAAFALFVLIPRGTTSTSAVVQAQPGAAAWDSGAPTTILLVGAPDASSAAATSFVVASYEPATRALALLSIPANLWVTVPGFGHAPLGQAYADGGLRLMLVTVQSVLGMPIPYYAFAGSRASAQIIDAFGGTPVRLPARVSIGTGTASHALGPGPVLLDGADTMAYLHSAAGSGYVTAENALLSLLRQMQTPDNRVRLASVLNSLGPSIQTDFPLNRVPDLLHALGSVSSEGVIESGIGALTGTAIPYTASGVHVLLPRWDQIRGLARRLLPGPHAGGAVAVWNGTAVPGQAAALAAWLGTMHIRVRSYTTAPTGSYPRTTVLVSPGATDAQRALGNDVATLLQVPVVTQGVSSGKVPVTVIIGRDFQSPAQQ